MSMGWERILPLEIYRFRKLKINYDFLLNIIVSIFGCDINHSIITLVLYIMQNFLWLMEMDLSYLALRASPLTLHLYFYIHNANVGKWFTYSCKWDKVNKRL